MVLLTIALPLVIAGAALLLRDNARRPRLLPLAAGAHLALTLALLILFPTTPDPSSPSALGLDPPGAIVLLLVSVLFFFAAIYGVGYLRARHDRDNRLFVACTLAVLALLTLVATARHVGLAWVAVESTTLAGAPLIYFNRNPRSLEATWRYLVVGSIGIALALLGSFFLGYAALAPAADLGAHAVGAHDLGPAHASLLYDDLLARADTLSIPWLEASMVLLVIGYGTKMGLAPMHTWKPDAYGESPGMVGAIFAGGTASGAFLVLLRSLQVADRAGAGAFAHDALIALGLASMAVAAAFAWREPDLKRLLAWSSVEHMGLLAIGLGLGGAALFGALLHLVMNGLTKGVLFLAAANIHRAYGTSLVSADTATHLGSAASPGSPAPPGPRRLITGAIRRLPVSGTLLLLGFLAAIGSPPFGPFVSELWLLRAAFADHVAVGIAMVVLLFAVFIGMGRTILAATQGAPPPPPDLPRGPIAEASAPPEPFKDTWLTAGPIAALMALVLVLGVALPAPLARLVAAASTWLQGAP
ncbi:MAG: hydrogenase [Deltaproteobacteria bacterium]|nr:hydrogenase [Deltaproteobacteria bacterium]